MNCRDLNISETIATSIYFILRRTSFVGDVSSIPKLKALAMYSLCLWSLDLCSLIAPHPFPPQAGWKVEWTWKLPRPPAPALSGRTGTLSDACPKGPAPGPGTSGPGFGTCFHPLNWTLHRLPRDYLPWDRARVVGPPEEAPWTPCLPGANPQTEPTGPARRLTPSRAGGFKKWRKGLA